MRNKFFAAMLLFSAFGSANSAVPKWETHSCYYSDIAREITLSGRCQKQATKINGNFAYILTWPSGNKITIEYINSQSGNHIWKINGKLAAAVEINRENLRGFTLDLNQLIEWKDNP